MNTALSRLIQRAIRPQSGAEPVIPSRFNSNPKYATNLFTSPLTEALAEPAQTKQMQHPAVRMDRSLDTQTQTQTQTHTRDHDLQTIDSFSRHSNSLATQLSAIIPNVAAANIQISNQDSISKVTQVIQPVSVFPDSEPGTKSFETEHLDGFESKSNDFNLPDPVQENPVTQSGVETEPNHTAPQFAEADRHPPKRLTSSELLSLSPVLTHEAVEVHVVIGHLDARSPQVKPAAKSASASHLSLSDYLNRRNGGGKR
jgi:hypothetical protein